MTPKIPEAAKTCELCGRPARFVVHGNIYHVAGANLYGDGVWTARNYVRPDDVAKRGYCKPCFVAHLLGVGADPSAAYEVTEDERRALLEAVATAERTVAQK